METRYYFTDSTGKILGPVVLSEIQAYVETGHIDPTAEVCVENETEWTPYFKVVNELAASDSQDDAKTTEVAVATQTSPPPVLKEIAVEHAPKKLTLRALLEELQSQPVYLQFNGEDGTEEAASIENIGEDLLTLTLSENLNVVHVPMGRLFRITESLETGRAILDIR